MSVTVHGAGGRSAAPAPVPSGQAADNLRGASIMAFSMAVYTSNDAVMKFVAEDLPIYQSIALRSGFSVLMLLLVVWLGPWRIPYGALRNMGRRNGWLMAVRMFAEIGSTMLYLTAITHMALGDISAISQSTPLFIVLAAALFLGEKVGWRRFMAIGIGMAGMLIILRPGTPRFDFWALMALLAVLLVVVRDISTRLLSASLPPLLVAVSAATSVGLFSLVVSLTQGWTMPAPGQIGLLLLAAALVSLGYFTAIMTMRIGDVSFSAPFRYVSLVVAVILGYVIFGEFPDLWTWVGAGMIVGAGLFVIWREARLDRPRRAARGGQRTG